MSLRALFRLSVVLLPACADAPPDAARAEAEPWLSYSVVSDTVLLGQSIEDTLLLQPVDLAAGGGALVIADAMLPGATLVPLDAEGRLGQPRAILGQGGGPFEFEDVVAVARTAHRIAIADSRNRRVSLFDSAGAPVSEISVPNGAADIAFDSRGRLHVRTLGADPETAAAHVAVFDAATGGRLGDYGVAEERVDWPTTGMHNRARLAPGNDGAMWLAYAYRGTVYPVSPDLRLGEPIILDPELPPQDSYVEFLDDAGMAYAVKREEVIPDIAALPGGGFVALMFLDANRPSVRPRPAVRFYDSDGRLRGEQELTGSMMFLRIAAAPAGLLTLGLSADYNTRVVRLHRLAAAAPGGP